MATRGDYKSSLWLLALCLLVSNVHGQDGQLHGFISFVQSQLVIDEGTGLSGFTAVQIPLEREGGTTGLVFAGVEIQNANENDFLATSAVASFPDGVTNAMATVVVVNDALPEGNETFTVIISDARSGAEVGLRNTMELIIRANDEPFGSLQFESSSLSLTVSEPQSSSSQVQLTVIRGPGTFSRVTVDYQVTSDLLGVDDLSSFQGQLIFDDQVSSQPLNLSIHPDNIPESDETFTIQLTNPRGGATLADDGTVAMVTIRANDSPVRWNQSVIEVSEDVGSVDLTIIRGLLEDGSFAGDISQTTTVLVSTTSGTALAGVDFDPVTTTITFPPGSTSQTVSVPITNDIAPEGDEIFSVVISSPSPDAVLVPPSTLMVVIAVNDNAGGIVSFASPAGPVVIREDIGEVGRFRVQRSTGTFGNLTIEWTISDNIDQSLASADFQPPSGTLVIPDGASEADLEIVAFNDDLAEVAEGFTVQLVRVVSGDGVLSESGVRVASLIIAESDDVYGLVEWGQQGQFSITGMVPRELRLVVARSRGNIGTISVDFSILYLPVGSSEGDAGVVSMAMDSVQLQGGQSECEFSVTILDSAFLEPGGMFQATLTNATLTGGATLLIPSMVSPNIGPQATVMVAVPPSAANGYIGFDPVSLQTSVDEPEATPTSLSLTVTRTGFYGLAQVTWSITLLSADFTDIGATSGSITIPDGQDRALLNITVLPDDTPEVDELFMVALVTTNQLNQRILQTQSVSTVTILQNDAAEGVFSISPLTAGPFVVQESGIVSIAIVREGGALTSEVISYSIPGGMSEILGGQSLAVFGPGQRESFVTLLINNDDIPETNETYRFEISSLTGGSELLGMLSSVEITILANDDYAGLFLFASSSLDQTTTEPRNGSTSVVTFTVQRSRGTFTEVSVQWIVTGGGADLQQTGGVVIFAEGQSSGTFQINVLPDNVPESDEVFVVSLLSVSEAGVISSSFSDTTLTVVQNDDPINFQQSFLSSAEGDNVEFVLERGGQAADSSDVIFMVDYQTASSDDVIIVPVGGVVTFLPGETQTSISVGVVNDGVPEESELLLISLVSTTGDSVIVSPSQVTLLVAPSDDPNGVFQFESGMVDGQEGDTVILSVERLGGDFGQVSLSWIIYPVNNTGSRITGDVNDISPTTNIVTFDFGNTTLDIELSIVDDVIPELEETFQVEISILNVIGDSPDGARIGNVGIATVSVAPSDDPYGLFSVGRSSVEVAEDIPTDDPSLGLLSLPVRRGFGRVGDVRVTWEILTSTLPPYNDLLFVGEAGSEVIGTTSRPHTGTRALSFTSQIGSLVDVPQQQQPLLTDQLSISLWMQPTPGTSGVLVAQATSSSPLYRLSLVADSVNYIIRFSYRSSSTFVSVETSIPQATISEGAWHSLVVTATNLMASFYVDGSFLTSRILTSPDYSGRGQLTVGGVSDSISTSDFYSGALQDVRLFSIALTQSEITTITSDVAALAISPISGYLTYAPDVTMATISAASIDDTVPEPSQEFVVQLANAVGGARIDPSQNVAQLTILKSDSSNGVFGFESSSVAVTTDEGMRLSLIVTRSEGSFEEVSVYWEITQEVGGVSEITTMDFEPSSDQIQFVEGQLEGRINLTVVNELVPELMEQFTIRLTAAVANDNQTSSTPLSGASINSSVSQSSITVVENDSPYGLFQFVTSPPLPGVTIAPATTMPEIFVDETVGTVTVYVVRAQGLLGDANVEYVTSEASAVSGGGQPDFEPTAGSLTFTGTSLVQSLTVSILDNTQPELEKTFYVNLTNPTGVFGSPDLGVGSTLAVHIQPSDDAFGLFNFRSDSQARVVAEQPGGSPVTLTVIREGGVFGDVELYWRVSGSLGSEVMDITPDEGMLEFSEGSSSETIELVVRDDQVAELLEVFSVQLVNVSVGASLGPVTTATITIAASDHPYGLFTFAPPPTGVGEGQEVVVTVNREFGILGQVSVGVLSISSSDVVSDPRLSSLGLDLTGLEQGSQLASTGLDYSPVNVTLTFNPGQTTASLTISLLEDPLPELQEFIFLTLAEPVLNTSSVDSVDTSVLPLVATGNGSITTFAIAENDNARGVVELSQVAVTTSEPSQAILSLLRSEGTFGQISVQWEVSSITASTSDYSPVGGMVTFEPGVSTRPLPLLIVNDNEPEFSEEFIVRLVGVTGSAVLGDVTAAMVTIEANDDPNGALEFAVGSLNVEVAEPSDSPVIASFTVQRMGGAVGVVELSWNVSNVDGSPAESDVLPVSGTLQFVSNSREQTIRLSVLPDDIPEVAEMFTVSLGSVTGGARVVEGNSLATLTIPENDGPFGVVSFTNPTSVAMEIGDNGTSVTMVPIIRSLGTFGDIRVFYTVQSADAAILALSSGTPLLDFYTSGSPGESLTPQSELQTLVGSLEDCARTCLSNQACRSLSITGSDCTLYFTSQSEGADTIVAMGTVYYEKIQELAAPFYQAVASDGNDFSSAIGQVIVIPDGVAMATVPVTIVGDSTPELNESLVIQLVDVELISSSIEGVTPSGEPLIGSVSLTTLVILENDDPRGRFAIYGSNGASVSRVSESEMFNFGVSLTVERLGGTLGVVSVEWGVVNSTAVEGEDYTGSGAVLTFNDGESRATVAITILPDNIPERDETIQIVLSNPMGGANIGPGDEGRTLVIIEANDAAGGVVGFDSMSRSAVIGEGESGGVQVVRSVSALGVVTVNWRLSATDGSDPSDEFVNTLGTATFEEGANLTEIVIQVQSDSTPEVAERYTLTLTSVQTLSDNISPSGHATLDPQATMATVTIRASNNPHGVFEFQSVSVRVSEGEAESGATVVRQFGSFGSVDVSYEVQSGSLSSNGSLATSGDDFVSEVGVVRLEDGQQSAVISVNIVDDSLPELNEVFLVSLTSVTLISGGNDTIPPSIGATNVTEIIIPANDSPQGEMTFAQTMYEITEDVGVFELPVLRVQGLVGEVSVVYFVTNQLAVNGDDFVVEQLEELVFAPGQMQRTVAIAITDDNLPEVAEAFCVQLQLPRAGAVLGNITTTCISIVANDDAYGVFSFDSASLSTVLQETQDTTTANNVAELRVIRSGGLFGQITVPFEVRSSDSGIVSTSDLSPLMGSALVFNQEESFKILQLEALEDSIPELDETFIITLLPPAEQGRLATTNTMASVTIESNQDPFGVFDLSLLGGVTSVEEGIERIDFTVRRSFGTFGQVSVTMETVDGTATFQPGDDVSYVALQSLTGGLTWHSVRSGLLVLGRDAQADVLAWRGVFTVVQSLQTIGQVSFSSFSPQQGLDILLVANGGNPGNRELTVDVYQFSGPETVNLVQSLPSVGATDLATFTTSDGQCHIVVANGENSEGNAIVDSTLWVWNGTRLEQVQTLPTQGASSLDVFLLSGSLYLAVGSLTDTRSQVYIWRDGQLRLNHTFDSQAVNDVIFLSPSTLAVSSITSGLSLLTWSTDNQQFVNNTTLPSNQPIRLERSSDSQQMFVTNSATAGQLFQFNAGSYIENTDISLPRSNHLYPFTIGSTPYLAAAAVGGASQSVVMETVLVDRTISDYYSQSVNLTFEPGESELSVAVVIVDEVIPEIGESFVVRLVNPMGGARIATDAVAIEILTNDDAHGLIGFAQESLSVVQSEASVDSVVVLDVERMGGAFGQVTVSWEVSGDHGNSEVSPTQGQVVFSDGQILSNITLLIQADATPELNELTTVTLVEVLENGVPDGGDQSRGAEITPSRSQAVLTVQANDAPHGVITWSPSVVMATEEEGRDSIVQLTLIREFGSIGAIVIGYSTIMASSFPLDQQATELVDFVPTSGEVVMGNGERSASVGVTILHDNLAELTESFFVNITSVRLVNEDDRQGSMSDSPRLGLEAVQVQISENDDSRGSLSFSMTTVSVGEVVGGRVQLEVRREGGTFGAVGAEFTAVGLSASNMDFEPSTGTVTFDSGVGVAFLTINIVNDPEPELDETFEVRLVAGVGGATIGMPSLITVTILSNDDISGVFSFTNTSLLFLIPESSNPSDPMGVVTLTVQRTGNSVGVVTVYWEVGVDGLADLEPTSGNLTFDPMTTSQSFQVRAVDDGLPELFEAFSVRLVRTEGGGRIVDPREARIAIQSSNDPSGVVGFFEYPQGIVASEGVEVQVGVVRSSGSQGTVTLTWSLSPPDSTVFLTTTDTVVFTDGQTEATFAIQTLSDNIPEVARLFSLDIVSSSLASIDINASHVDLVIAANNNPHGSVQFESGAVSVMEGDTGVEVRLVRGVGLVGDLRVNLSLQLDNADQNDFNISGLYVMFLSGQSVATLSLDVFDDDLPEVTETFSITITSVELLGNGGRDFVFNGDSTLIDQPPTVGSTRVVTMTIQSSDDPFGSISLSQSIISAREGGTANVTLTRTGGTFNVATATYTTSDGLATAPSDYLHSEGTVVFPPGETSASVLISVVDDDDPELEEDFTFTVVNTDVAALGPVTMATVIISASDSPFGIVGFEESVVMNGVQLSNPSLSEGPHSVTLTVVRSGGVIGSTDITWAVTQNGESPRDDITPVSGTLILTDGQSSGSIEVFVLPSNADELQESYMVTLQLASNNVFVATDLSTVLITVAQMGNPLGVVSFIGDVIGGQRVNEDINIVTFPVVRTGTNTVSMEISYVVTRVSGDGTVDADVSPSSGSLVMPAGIGQVNLDLSVVSDGVPELDESFLVSLTSTNTDGVSIDPQANTAGFTIIANDSPFGQFSLSIGANPVTVDTSGGLISRTLTYTIERSLGQVGDILVTVSNSFEDQSMDPQVLSRLVPSDSTQLIVSVPLTQGRSFLLPGSEFTITIINATVTAPSEFIAQSADVLNEGVVGVVSDTVSNPLIAFDQSSLSASVDDSLSEGNVVLTVTRTGLLSIVDVVWSVGPLSGGSLTPTTGTVSLLPDQTSAQITLSATPTEPHGTAELFSVSLTAQTRTPMFPAMVDTNADTAVIEPWGVVQLGGVAFTGVEGLTVAIPVWRRYGSTGSIIVTGTASASTNIPTNQIAASEGVDFPSTPQSVAMGDGQTVGYINISLPDNSMTSPLKVFTFQLTSVDRTTPTGTTTTPRLSLSNLIGQVTIIDDEGGAGVFRISPTSANIEEGRLLAFTVVREGGATGQVTVRVTSENGLAVGGEDYSLLDEVLVFQDSQTERLLSLNVLDDDVPEPEEGFRVQLTMSEGGGALIDPLNSALAVSIAPSDNPGGVLTISTPSPLTLVDGSSSTATVVVDRDPMGGLIGEVLVNWIALYTDTDDHVPLANILTSTSGTITFLNGQTESNINIELALIANAVPVGGEIFVVRISSPTPGVVFQTTDLEVRVQPRAVAVFQIRQEDKTRVVTTPGSVTMTIQRTDGLQLSSTVVYNASSVERTERQPPRVGELTFDLAQPGVHFARIENVGVTFEPGVSDNSVTLSVISVPTTPRAFFMDIGLQGGSTITDEAIIVIMPSNTLSSLYSIYFDSLTVSTSQELEMLSSQLLVQLGQVTGANSDQSDAVRLILEQFIQSTLLSGSNIALTDTYRDNMLDIFQLLVSDQSFTGQSEFVQFMKIFAYSLVEDLGCPDSNTEELRSHTRASFHLEAVKIRPSTLVNRQFVSVSGTGDTEDYIQFPAQSLTTTQTCVTVHFIEFLSDQVFGQPTLRSKVMSVGVADRNIQPPPNNPILLRLYSSESLGVIPDQNDCIQWSYPTGTEDAGTWSSEFCYPVTEYSDVLLQNSVMCACRQFGDMAVASDTTIGYSWTWPAGVSAGLVVLVMILVMVIHLCYFSRTQLATRILICLCLSVFLFQLMLLIDVFASRSPTLSDDGCVALGALLHFTIILQFVWILALAIALWVNFMGFTDGREPLIIYVIISWGLSIIIVVATILIGRFAVPLSNTELYFHTPGELCYMPLLSASLLSTVLPVVVAMLSVVAFLSHSCVYWSRWEDYHNMYHDSFNRTEIPLLLVFFALIFFTGLAGYLHVYVTVVYTYAAFVALNVIQALYALIVYVFVSWHTLTRKHKKFILGDEVEPLSLPEEPDYLGSMSSLSTNRHKMDPEEEWAEYDKDSDITPVVPVGVRRYPSEVSDPEDSHLDDLMFMLKTQTYQSEPGSKDTSQRRAKGAEHLELRRISIADTHL